MRALLLSLLLCLPSFAQTNQAPVVNAGADQTIAFPSNANLSATASDDGLPTGSTLGFQWTKVSGPGTVTFGTPTANTTTATFSIAGSYVLRFTATEVLGQTVTRLQSYAAPTVPAPLRTFFVDCTNGNDSAGGTSNTTPWRTIAKANATAQPGDLFLIRGTCISQVIRPAVSGTSANRITYRKETGQTATINGGVNDSLVNLSGRNYVVVDGLELTGNSSGYSVLLETNSNFNWLRNLNLHDVGGGVVISDNSNDNRLEDSALTRIGNEITNGGDSVAVVGSSHRNVIARNAFNYAGHSTIDVGIPNSFSGGLCNDNIVALNEVFNPWANGIDVNGRSVRTIVEGNTVHDTADGTRVNYARSGIDVLGVDNIVRYNRIWNTGADPITLQAYTFGAFVQNTTGNHIYHNTFWANGRSGHGGLLLTQKDQTNNQNNLIENNIFWSMPGVDGGDGNLYFIGLYLDHANTPWPIGSANGNIIRNNIFPAGTRFAVSLRSGVSQYYTKAQVESTFAGWTNNLQADPLFVNQTDVRLQSGSPAINTGRLVSGVTFSGSAPDLGAIEYGATQP